jgi:uncharacterized protein (DUF1800 family)
LVADMTSPATIWQPWQPTAKEPWDRRRVVHLHRRAGFAATWREIERDLKDGPQAAVDRILKGNTRIDDVPGDFEQMAAVIGDAAVASDNVNRLKAWWLYRMLFSPDPLGEKLTLLWHNHFATSNLKVNSLPAMRRQNEVFREFGRAPFAELLAHTVRDPALLIWLDAPANRKEHPNENLARELMEVFTLGVGHYTETDVKEAARALTGWSVTAKGEFREVEERHDEGEKKILGKTGMWRADDFVAMLLDHPATAKRLAFRICDLFMGEGTVDDQALAALADGLREHHLDVGWAVETVLRSVLFFSGANLSTRVCGPVDFVVGGVRALELFDPPPSTLVLSEWVANLGLDLFYPPNVFGWPGGRSWITTRSVIGRLRFATALVEGAIRNPAAALDALVLAQRHGRGDDLPSVVRFFSELLLGTAEVTVVDEIKAAVMHDIPNGTLEDTSRRTVATFLGRPEMQVH